VITFTIGRSNKQSNNQVLHLRELLRVENVNQEVQIVQKSGSLIIVTSFLSNVQTSKHVGDNLHTRDALLVFLSSHYHLFHEHMIGVADDAVWCKL